MGKQGQSKEKETSKEQGNQGKYAKGNKTSSTSKNTDRK